ncbi:MAG: HAD-IA family hydrolase [SAR324 cluster bacterium]|uniref:HAD-IA family hydrolase n=1 Tax=SAR324 cluster bacterium TaxID=2024889 RepID=A0A7X9IJB9_9DELT|nr:HAD-IA family hydrolase [SAR324 cluster bacterium]
MIKAILFDLDGVLVDADRWHFNALNVALQHSELDPISWQEHLNIYKGIPTRCKLEILTERRGLPRDLWEAVKRSKQEITLAIIDKFCMPDPEKTEMMRLLKRRFRIGICSNAVRETVERMLTKSGLIEFAEFYLSNQDVEESKPSPEIYLKAFDRLGVRPDECVIVEDSDVGKRAAVSSGGVLCSVAGPMEVNYYRVMRTVNDAETINVVIPAAGQGKRFAEVGFVHPKPLIDVAGYPMISLVLRNFKTVGRPVVIMQKKHIDVYCADEIIKQIEPAAKVVATDGLTEGAACTVLLASCHIDNNAEIIIANSDQYIDCDINSFISEMRRLGADGGMLTFRDSHPKWSYARIGDDGRVVEVAEKRVISDQATVGIYYFRHGSDFVRFASDMIQKNQRVNGEFYVCPVFNEMIASGKNVYAYEIPRTAMHGLGTPEDLSAFLASRGSTAETNFIELDSDLPFSAIRDNRPKHCAQEHNEAAPDADLLLHRVI